MGVKRNSCNKADGSVVDDVQFIEKSFGGRPIYYVTVIKDWEDCHFNQSVLCRVGERCFVTEQKTNSRSD